MAELDSVVIAFGHRARHGKDTAINAIIEERGKMYDIRRYGFADALKMEVNREAELTGGMLALFTVLPAVALKVTGKPLPEWVRYEADADMTDPLCPLGKQRTLLQWFGAEFRRARDPFYWVRKLRERLVKEKPQFALISDARFVNEMAFVKSFNGFTVRMDRTGSADLISSVAQTHASERDLDTYRYDYVIEAADGDVAEVRKCAVWVFDNIVENLRGTCAFDEGVGELYRVSTELGVKEANREQARQAASGS